MENNYMNLKLSAVSVNEAFARSVVGAFCTQLNPTLDEINDVKTAVSEAVTNSIVHAYEGKGGEVEISARIEDGAIHIEVRDGGIGIADVEKARQPFFTTKPGDERSGMGFTVMESFMDSLEVISVASEGTAVKMSKRFGMNKEQAEQM